MASILRIMLLHIALIGAVANAHSNHPSGNNLDSSAQAMVTPTSFLEKSLANQEQMIKANANLDQWHTPGGDFGENRFSPLTQINDSNVTKLGFAWEYDTKTIRGLEATPVVVDGVMYTSGTWGKVYAVDAKTGVEIWFFDPQVPGQVVRDGCCGPVNRGVAVWADQVYVAALDGRLFSLDARTGKVLWEVDTITDHTRSYTSTGAPRIAGNVVVIGNAGAEYDARGYVSAFDLETGELEWRFFTVPGSPEKPYEHPELEVAAATWDPKSLWEVGGGGTVWDSMVYDPVLNLLYVGTGNSAVYLVKARSPSGGDNLYLSSILAINPDNGELAWHYQTTPGDSWDYTATQNMVLAEIEIKGQTRDVIMQAPKNGFFYVLDRTTGELLSANNYAPVNWASHVDMATGKPVLTEDSQYYDEPKVIWPAQVGAHGWRPMAYNKVTRLVYIPVYEAAQMRVNLFPEGYEYTPNRPSSGVVGFAPIGPYVDFYASVLPSRYSTDHLKEIISRYDVPKTRGVLKAWNPVTQEMVWEADAGGERNDGGILTTAGNLVIYGKSSGQLIVRNATTGELLHEIDLGTGIMAAPMTYSIDGEQYVAVMAGLGGGGFFRYPPYSAAYKRSNKGRLIAFKLGGGETTMAEVEPELHFPQPPEQTGTPETIARGNEQFLWYCAACHNNAGRGTVPDLRYLGAGKHLIFDQIVREGILSSQGMPQFADILSKEDTDAIQSFLIDQAWRSFSRQEAAKEDLPSISTH